MVCGILLETLNISGHLRGYKLSASIILITNRRNFSPEFPLKTKKKVFTSDRRNFPKFPSPKKGFFSLNVPWPPAYCPTAPGWEPLLKGFAVCTTRTGNISRNKNNDSTLIFAPHSPIKAFTQCHLKCSLL